ncbi:MAG: hypothetical protein KF857_04735 [Fimbriimonadaceae bacterium]|nr:hypothetical protein [Fimbriimonadaceae bacterium]
MFWGARVLTLAAVAGFAVSSRGAGPRSLPGVKTATPPVVDGDLAPGEWARAAHGEGFFDQNSGQACAERAEFWIMYDAKFIYFAGRAYTDPKKIVADEYRPNVSLAGNDGFLFAIDAAASGQDIDLFRVNAQGATNLRLSGGRAAKTEWLGEFDAKGKITADGWQVEARVPWRLINRPKPQTADVVFNMMWLRSADGRGYEWEYTKGGYENFPKLTGVEIPLVPPDRSVKLLPYGYAGVDDDGRAIFNGGLDFKTSVRDSLTLVGTVNPDFRNIENNILNLDHSYFERLADDARPFFQEGSRFRTFGFGFNTFTPQRVHDFDFGVNLYGSPGSRSQLSVLSTFDFGNQGVFAGAFQQRVDEYSLWNVGYVRDDMGKVRNDAVNALYDWRAGNTEYYVGGMFTHDSEVQSGSRFTAGAFNQSPGSNWSLEYSQVTPSFFPRLGFAPEADLRGVSGGYGVNAQPKSGPFSSVVDNVNAQYYTHMDGSPYRWEVQNQFAVDLRSNWSGVVVADVSRFEGSDDYYVQFQAGHPIVNVYRGFSFGGTVGRFGGRPFRSLQLGVNYRPVKRMQLNARAQWVSFTPDQKQFVLTANYDLGHFDALAGRVVLQDSDWNWYLSYRLSGKKGNEFFVILGDPNATHFKKSLVLKAVVPVSF